MTKSRSTGGALVKPFEEGTVSVDQQILNKGGKGIGVWELKIDPFTDRYYFWGKRSEGTTSTCVH